MSQTFTCRDCGKSFSVRPDILARYPGWKPAQCLDCKNGKSKAGGAAKKSGRPAKARSKGRRKGNAKETGYTTAQVLEKYSGGPQSGVFTDGACQGNPGPGGWGVVWVRDGEILDRRHGHEGHTTNNRMELMALIEAYRMLPDDAEVELWSDSNLCVKTLNEWAAGWERRGWKRKTGPVENLDLVKEAYRLHQAHKKAKLRWIKAHDGSLWNEYADALATAFQRDEI